MLDKDPTGVSLLTLMWFVALAMLGGLVSFIQKLNAATEPKPLRFIFLRFLSELIISGFAGLVTFYICQYYAFKLEITSVLCAISGHMGGVAIEKIENMWDTFTKSRK